MTQLASQPRWKQLSDPIGPAVPRWKAESEVVAPRSSQLPDENAVREHPYVDHREEQDWQNAGEFRGAPRIPGIDPQIGNTVTRGAIEKPYDPTNVLPTDVLGRMEQERSDKYNAPGSLGRMGAVFAGGVDTAIREAGSGWSEIVAGRGLGGLADSTLLGGQPTYPAEDFRGIMSPDERDANDERAAAANAAERFAGGILTMPATFADPKTLAAMLISHSPSSAVGKAVFNPKALAAIEQKFGTQTMIAVENMGRSAISGEAFGAVDASLRGGQPGEIIEGAAMGTALGVPFGLAGMTRGMVAERGSVRAAESRIALDSARRDIGAFDPSTGLRSEPAPEHRPPARQGEVARNEPDATAGGAVDQVRPPLDAPLRDVADVPVVRDDNNIAVRDVADVPNEVVVAQDSPPGESPQSVPEAGEIRSLFEKRDTDYNYTFEDMVEDIGHVADESGNRSLKDAVEKYRREAEDDAALSGRGDMDQAEAEFETAVRAAIEPPKPVLPPTPESPATLAAQMQALNDGKRPAVLVTPGEKMPDKGRFARLKTEAGTFIYDPKRIKPTEIKLAVAEDRIGDVLGLGTPRKPADATEAVVVRTPEGVEKQAVATNEATLPAVTEAARKLADPGDTIGVEPIARVVGERVSAARAGDGKSRLAAIKKEIQPLIDKGDLTQDEAKRYRDLSNEAESIRFDLSKEPQLTDIPPSEKRNSTLSAESVLEARKDLRRDKSIYMALSDAAAGAEFNADTVVDAIVTGKHKSITAKMLYDNFSATREALRKQYGDTITLFRAVGKQKGKATTNWATTRAFAEQFGDNVVSRQIAVDDVLAVNVGLRGNYHEVVVLEKGARGVLDQVNQAGGVPAQSLPNFAQLPMADLRAEAKKRGIPTSGTKAKLVADIHAHDKVRVTIKPKEAQRAAETQEGGRPVPTDDIGRKADGASEATKGGVENPSESPPPEAPARRPKAGEFGRSEIERRLTDWYDSNVGQRFADPTADTGLLVDEDVGGDRIGRGGQSATPFTTAFSGKMPPEVREHVAGRPGLRRLIKENVKGAKGDDAFAEIPDYLDRIDALAGTKAKRAIEEMEKIGDDPEVARLLLLHRILPEKMSERKPFHVIDKPGDLPDGTTFEIGGEKFGITRDDWGAMIVKEDGTPFMFADDALPIDAGSLKGPEAKAKPVAKPKETIGQGEGVFGQRVIDPATGSQQSMFGESKAETPKTGADAVDAKIAAQYDPKNTPEMFGDEPKVSRARTDEPPGEFGEEGGPETTGIAHRVSEAQGMEAPRGEGIGPEASVERGRELLKGGMDPKQVIADFKRDGLVNHDRMAVVRAWEADLAKKSIAADEKYGAGSKQSNAAFEAWKNAKAEIKPMQTEWSKIGAAQMGETEIDTGTFHGMRAAFFEESGRDFTPKQAEAAKQKVAEVQAKTKGEETAKQKVRELAESAGETEPHIKSLADRIVAKLDKAAADALARFKARHTGATLRSGIDPADLADLSIYGAAKVAKGFTRFGEWSVEMVKDIGESIRPHLRTIWEAADKQLDRHVAGESVHEEVVKQVRAKPLAKGAPPEKIAARANSKTTAGQLASIAKELSRAFIRKGVTEREANVDAVHSALSDALPTLTREQTSDAMSGYGDFRPLNKDPIEVRRREIAGEVQQVRKLQDMASGKAPLKSGVERQSPTDEARDLTRRVNEAKKAGGYVTTDPATQLRTALDARKTYVRNRITDLQKQIDAGVKAKKSNKPAPTDAQLDALRARLKAVKEHYDKKFPEDKTPEKIQAVKDQIAELDKHLKAGTVPAKSPKPATPKDVADLRDQRDALRSKVMEADPARREAIRQQIKVLEGHLKAGTKPVPEPAKPAPADIQALRDKRDALAKQLRKPPPVDVSTHPPGTVMTPERVKELWKLTIPHAESGVTNFQTLVETLSKQTGLPIPDIRRGLTATGKSRKTLAELDDAAWALHKAKKNAKDWLRAQKPKTPLQKVLHYTGVLRALETTGELSVLGIQGSARLPMSIGHALTHPMNPKMLAQDIRTFYKGIQSLSPRRAREIDLAMERNPNYQKMQRDGLRLYDEDHVLSGTEEIRANSIVDRIWGVGHTLRAFNRFSRIVLNDIKINTYERLAETVPNATKAQGKVIADIANLAGGTTNMGSAERIMGFANGALYSARLAAARARFLASPVEFAIRGDNATRRAYAKEMANWMIGTTAIYSAFALAGYEIGDDPRSNKFGKVKIGETWVDMTGGLSSYVTFGTRQALGETITDKGNLRNLGESDGPFAPSRLSIAASFARGKLAPWPSMFVDWMDNKKNVIGKPMDGEYFARKVSPLTWWDVAQAVREESPTDAAAIAVLALFGKSVRNRPDPEEENRQKPPTKTHLPTKPHR